jgi:hypothetical protein
VTAIVKNINDYPAFVPILNGAATALVAHRELRNKYHTNRSIKTWSCFFLLKALTTSGKISQWTTQKKHLLTWCQCNENTFRHHLAAMKEMKLVTIDKYSKSISLTSYEKAAEILDIPYTGITKIKYSPDDTQGKQVFRFFITAEEFRKEQQKQLEGLTYWLNKNLLLKNDLHLMLLKFGADDKQLRNPAYYQQRLLAMQMQLFKEGSDILSYVFSRRADINRGVKLIAEHHKYKSKQSVSYLQRCMARHKVIDVKKICVESKSRSRIYIPDGLDKRRDGYKWLDKKGHTAWFLTNQIVFNYEIQQPEKLAAKRAA